MWFRFRFCFFGKEIWSFEVDREDGFDSFELEEDSDEEEEEEEDEPSIRWGEPCCFERDIFVP